MPSPSDRSMPAGQNKKKPSRSDNIKPDRAPAWRNKTRGARNRKGFGATPQEEAGLVDSRLWARCQALIPAVETRITNTGPRGLAAGRHEFVPGGETGPVAVVRAHAVARGFSAFGTSKDPL